MKLSRSVSIFIASIIAGLILGLIGGPALILLPWAVVGLAIGVTSADGKSAILNGSVFGFIAAFTFMIVGYEGQASLTTRLLPFVLLGLVGAMYGLIFSIIGRSVYRRIGRAK